MHGDINYNFTSYHFLKIRTKIIRLNKISVIITAYRLLGGSMALSIFKDDTALNFGKWRLSASAYKLFISKYQLKRI